MMRQKQFLGIFINLPFFQSEGIEHVFRNLELIGADAISFFPRVAQPGQKGVGRRFPDLHVDGHRRVLSRPLWGQNELYLQHYCSYEPDRELYATSGYSNPLPYSPEIAGQLAQDVISEAHDRAMKVYINVHPLLPPEIKQSDQPVYIDGTTPKPPRVAENACLNNPNVQAYAVALIEDVLKSYPNVDGLFTDWGEYGAYRLEDLFTCFCTHCRQQAVNWGFDWNLMTSDAHRLWNWLHNLAPGQLYKAVQQTDSNSGTLEVLMHYPGWLSNLRFKARSVFQFHRNIRNLLDELGHPEVGLSVRGWPPPWNRLSGMDYHELAQICDAVAPKLFLFDYAALPRWYGETLLRWNPSLSEPEILAAMTKWMDLPDGRLERRFEQYYVPAPEERHTVPLQSYRSRVDEVVLQVDHRTKVYPFAHAYLPDEQWAEMLTLLKDSDADGMWVQMYGYLSDQKLQILKRIWH